jgi:hypothetical protein
MALREASPSASVHGYDDIEPSQSEVISMKDLGKGPRLYSAQQFKRRRTSNNNINPLNQRSMFREKDLF